MNPIKRVIGTGVPITIDDVDTDRIIPARFLRCVTFDGIGEYAFYDERFDGDGKETNFPMNNPIYADANIILSGKNFGCGSSREHAPQSLKRAGIQVIIAESFAEIFFGNSLTIGLACISMSKEDISKICRHVAETPKAEIEVDLENTLLKFKGDTYKFSIPVAARTALVAGTYDLLGELLSNKGKTAEIAASLPR